MTGRRPRPGPLLIGGLVVVLVAGLTACTGSAVTASISASMPTAGAHPPAESPSDSSGSAHPPDGTSPAPASTGTGPAPATTGEGTDAAGSGGGADTGGSGGELDPITTYPVGSAKAALATLLPGMYGLAELGATVAGHSATISTSGHCDFVLDVLGAGQWGIQMFATPHPGSDPTLDSHTYAAIMTRGDRVAIANLDDSAYACTGAIVSERPEKITVTGAAKTTGTADFLPLYCRPVLDPDSDTPQSHTVIGLYRTAGASYLFSADVPAAKGTRHLDPDVDQVVSLVPLDPKKPAYAQVDRLLTTLYDPLNATDSDAEWEGQLLASGWTSQTDDTADETAQVTVTATQPFAGTFAAKKLTSPDKPSSTVSVSLDFSCDG